MSHSVPFRLGGSPATRTQATPNAQAATVPEPSMTKVGDFWRPGLDQNGASLQGQQNPYSPATRPAPQFTLKE